MQSFGKLCESIWSNEDFRKLNAAEQQLYCLLISFPTRNFAGVLPITLRRWANCTADATESKIRMSISVLEKENFVVVDWDTEEILVRTMIKNDEVYKQPNIMKAAFKDARRVESGLLRGALQRELLALPAHKDAETTREMALSLVKTPREPLANPSRGVPRSVLEVIPSPSLPFGEPPGVGTYVSDHDAPPPTPTPPPPPTPAPSKRGTRLPDGWVPPPDVIKAMKQQFPHINLQNELEKFSDYWQAKPGKDAAKLDWVKTWRNWVRNAAERTPAPRNGTLVGTDAKGAQWLSMMTGDQDDPARQLH